MNAPRLIVVAGANGAGKSTLTLRLAQRFGNQFGLLLDPDAVARAFAPDEPSRASIQAARFILEMIDRAFARRERFIVETTLSDRNHHLDLLGRAQRLGYKTWLYYIGLESAALYLARVQQRVARGGHDIPDEDIVRCFERSRANLPDTIRLVDRAMIYDNSARSPRLIASLERGILRRPVSGTGWWTPLIQPLLLET